MNDADERASSAEESSVEEEVELLVQGRAKRSTAGNRLNNLLTVERDEEDVVELLFAEQEGEDADFDSGAEGGSDVDMDSSSDDDDQGPAAGADDLEGELELQKQAKADRKKERKKLQLPRKPQRRLARAAGRGAAATADPTSAPAMAPPPKPDKKKVERATWLPDGLAVRASSRKQTMQNKEVTQQRIKENETRRRRTLQAMEAAASKKKAEAAQSRAMTQEERMAEAARVERVNAKSLNRWQAEEARRAEERQAKLDALKNRKLEGPVVTMWSGPAIWVDGKLKGSGAKQVEEVTQSEANKAKARAEREAAKLLEPAASAESIKADTMQVDDQTQPMTADQEIAEAMSGVAVEDSMPEKETDKMDTTPDVPRSESQPAIEVSSENPTIKIENQPQPPSEQTTEQSSLLDENLASSAQQNTPKVSEPSTKELQVPGAVDQSQSLDEGPSEAQPSSTQPSLIEIASHTLVALHNVDQSSFPDYVLAQISQPRRKNARMNGKQPVQASCPITGQPAKFRDPQSGVAYRDIWSYNQIRRLYHSDEEQRTAADGARYSELLGCFVGGNRAANGVPDKFRQYIGSQPAWMQGQRQADGG